ncbi:MAG TPA: family 10 glycosylhydrolase [Planctomycetota bacterium]|nr:family 10 glycosylhydrolase [Planctomycetota bacterium]HRR79231.1 family 10 glycosylhydrolase [Planctomycetota bacterium]HRT94274.1 family 10 glycosylhydrolase [Planctomycetota bacterium]
MFRTFSILFAVAAAARAVEPPPKANYPLADDLAQPAAWKPMWGTAPAEAAAIEGRRALRLPCNFQGTKHDRASWDRELKLDLTACQGLQFDVYCADASPVSQFSLYLRSGGGWYATSFAPEAAGQWARVKIEKTDTRMEETPAGWGSVDTIRISAWRGANRDTEFFIANLGLLGADAPIAILRGESVAKTRPDEAQSVATFTKAVADTLDRLGLAYAVISDLDVTVERLKGKKIAILPHNPGLLDPVAAAIGDFLRGGGRLISFYAPPWQLRDLVGIAGGDHVPQKYRGHFAEIRKAGDGLAGMPPAARQLSWNILRVQPVEGKSRVVANWFNDRGEPTGEPAIIVSEHAIHMTHVLLSDDLANKDRLVLAMLGHFEPKLWEQVANAAIQRIGQFGRFEYLDGAARALRDKAVRLVAEREFPGAIATAAEAHQAAIAAYCAAQKPLRGEHRAFWCHSAFGPAGMEWDESIKVLAENGFTAILPNMLWGGLAYYESSVLPVAPEVKEKGDQIARCVAACRKHHVECHVWKVNYNMGWNAPKDFLARMKAEGRTQVMFGGKPEPTWLCPSHPDNQRLEIDAMVEVATKYDVDGVHFDYIRYPGPEGCFCPGCRDRFEKAIGAKVANWPADTRKDDAIRQKWLDFRREQITKVVSATAEQVRKAKPKVKISAAVFPNWAVDRDNVGQDWKLWCEQGWLDFVCPMDYTPHIASFENLVKQQTEWAGKVPCYPGIGLGVWPPGDNIVKLIDFIGVTRKLGTRGFTIFEYRAPEARDIVPLCGKGITRRE